MQPLDYQSTALPLEVEKTFPRMLNFVYLNPATCLFYDFILFIIILYDFKTIDFNNVCILRVSNLLKIIS